MGQHVFDLLRDYLAHYGYWAVAAALLLENAGLPVPGETMLLLASFLAFSEHHLRLPYIILVGVGAATIGDNLGFLLGHYGGEPLLERYRKVPMVCLATAHPAKFPDAVEQATGIRPPLPDRLADLLEREERYEVLPADLATVQRHVEGAVASHT